MPKKETGAAKPAAPVAKPAPAPRAPGQQDPQITIGYLQARLATTQKQLTAALDSASHHQTMSEANAAAANAEKKRADEAEAKVAALEEALQKARAK